MCAFKAAKIFLGYLLYLNASDKERERGLYVANYSEKEFQKAVGTLKELKSTKPGDIPGGYIILAALVAAREW